MADKVTRGTPPRRAHPLAPKGDRKLHELGGGPRVIGGAHWPPVPPMLHGLRFGGPPSTPAPPQKRRPRFWII